MALKKCRECGHDVSRKADKCPNCGAPVKPKTNFLAVVQGPGGSPRSMETGVMGRAAGKGDLGALQHGRR